MAATGGRRAPHAGTAAYALSPSRARLRSRGFPLRSGSPVGAHEPRRATHAAHSLANARAGPILHRGTRAKRVLLSPPVQGYARSGSGAAADAALPSPEGAPIRKVVQDFLKIPAREIEKAARKGGFSLYLII